MPLGLLKPQPKIEALDCIFVYESFAENFVIEQGQTVTKSWVMKNNGTQYIPRGSKLEIVDGDCNKLVSQPVKENVAVGCCFELEVKFEAPFISGHYIYAF